MLKTSYKHLNNIQKGSFAEAYAKMAFTLEGFEVYTTEYDDRGIDFVIRNNEGSYFSVQVKATGASASPFIYAEKFEASSDFLLCAVRLVEDKVPEIYLARGTDWNEEKGCLHINPGGGNAGAYYELRISKKYSESLKRHGFENYVVQLRGSPSDVRHAIELVQKECKTTEEIREHINERPFQPFTVCLADGKEIEVPTGDHAHLHPSGRTFFVHLDKGGTEIIDVRLVISLQIKQVA